MNRNGMICLTLLVFHIIRPFVEEFPYVDRIIYMAMSALFGYLIGTLWGKDDR